MRVRVVLCLGLLLLAVSSVVRAATAPVTIAWDAPAPSGVTLASFQVQRCTMATGQTTCVPTVDLPGVTVGPTTLTATDPAVDTTAGHCWTVVSVYTTGARSGPATTSSGDHAVCKAAGAGTTLPLAGPLTLTPSGSSLQVTWTAPTFDASTVPPSALTGYNVWCRQEPQTATTGWAIVATLPPTTLTWIHITPWKPAGCYQIRANYGTLGYKDNGTVCAAAPTPPPSGVVAPTNLRLAP
jgi:hypothetical protein